jgi:hypothetical protein
MGIQKETSCLVRINRAATYKVSEMKKRMFYRVDHVAQRIAHCFTDSRCMFEWVQDAITYSIRAFIEAVHRNDFEKIRFQLPTLL